MRYLILTQFSRSKACPSSLKTYFLAHHGTYVSLKKADAPGWSDALLTLMDALNARRHSSPSSLLPGQT